MNAYIHDLLRTLRSPGVLTLLVLLAVLGIAPTLLFSPGSGGAATQLAWGYSEDASGYQLVVYATNLIGNPAAGVEVNLSSMVMGGPPPPESQAATTDGGGLVHFSLAPNASGYHIEISSGPTGRGPSTSGEVTPLSPGTPGVGSGNLGPASHGLFPASLLVQVMLVGPGGGVPPAYRVEWGASPTTDGPPTDGYTALGSVSGYVTLFAMPTPANASDPFVLLRVLDANGTAILSTILQVGYGSSSGGPVFGPGEPTGAAAPGAGEFASLGALVGFFAPLLGIFAAHSAYTRDRLTGVLDNVLVRPVTRGGVMAGRFTAVALALVLGLGALVGILQLSLYLTLSGAFGLSVILVFYGALLVTTVSFAALTFLAAHLLRSSGTVLATMIGSYLALGVFGLFFLAFFGGLGAGFWNPALFLTVVTAYLVQLLAPTGFYSFSLANLTPLTFVLVALFWTVVPSLGAYVLATRRD